MLRTDGPTDTPSYRVVSTKNHPPECGFHPQVSLDKLEDLKGKFVYILRSKRVLERKYYGLVQRVEVLAVMIGNLRNNNALTEDDFAHLTQFDAEEVGDASHVSQASNPVDDDSSNATFDETLAQCASAFRIIGDFVRDLTRQTKEWSVCSVSSQPDVSGTATVAGAFSSVASSKGFRSAVDESSASASSASQCQAIRQLCFSSGSNECESSALQRLDISEISSCKPVGRLGFHRRISVATTDASSSANEAPPESSKSALYGTDFGAESDLSPHGDNERDRYIVRFSCMLHVS